MPVGVIASTHQKKVERYLAWNAGGGDGIVETVERTTGSGKVTEQNPLSLKVDVAAFQGYVSLRFAEETAVVATAAFTVPSANSRIDLVQWTLGVGINIKEGTESGSPSAPSADSDSIVLANVYCRTTMTTIKDTDDATNGYISVDTRVFL